MWPKEYFQILFKSLFRGYSIKNQNLKVKGYKKLPIKLLFIGVYNFLLGSLICILIPPFPNNFFGDEKFIEILYSVLLGSLGGCIYMTFLPLIYGIVGGICFGVCFGIGFGIQEKILLSFTDNCIYGIFFGCLFGVLSILSNRTPPYVYSLTVGLLFGIIFDLIIFYFTKIEVEPNLMGFAFYAIFFFLSFSRILYIPLLYVYFHKYAKKVFLWDENIAMPIPYLPFLIQRLAREQIEDSVNLALFLIEERPIFRRQAQKGIVLIASDQMAAFSSAQQIQNVRQKLSFLPKGEALPEEFNQSFAELLEIAQSVKVAEESINIANQYRLLKKTKEELADFQKSTNFSNRFLSSPMTKVARQWQKVLQERIEEIEKTKGLPLPNPFITGKTLKVQDETFVGRQDIIQQIQTEALRRGNSGAILFVGSRRTGKSSTLNNMQQYLPANLTRFYINSQSLEINSNIPTFCESIIEIINKGFKKHKLSPVYNLADLTKTFRSLQERLEKKNRYFLLCFDEYERLSANIANGKLDGLSDAIRSWIQAFDRFIFLFAGSHDIQEIKEVDWTDYLIEVRSVPISFLEESAALQLVTHPIPDLGLTYENEDLPNQFIKRLGRQPYLIQCSMFELVEYLNSNGLRKMATSKDIDIAIQKMKQTANVYFEHLWEKVLDEEGRPFLLQLAHEAVNDLPRNAVLKRLERKDFIRQENGSYVFCVPVFKEWILEHQ